MLTIVALLRSPLTSDDGVCNPRLLPCLSGVPSQTRIRGGLRQQLAVVSTANRSACFLSQIRKQFAAKFVFGRQWTQKVFSETMFSFHQCVKALIEGRRNSPGWISQDWQVDRDFLGLADSVGPIRRLRLNCWVPPSSVVNNVVSFNYGEPYASDERRQDENIES